MIRVAQLAAVVVVVAVTAARAPAQQPPGVPGAPRPAFSPYLNLARRDVPPGINYYGLIRPQLAAQANIQQLQQQVTGIQQGSPTATSDPRLPTTGVPAYFLNTGGYFQNSRSGGAPVNPVLATGRPAQPVQPTRPR